ncbi:hypothetical protein ACI6QG_10570 [Roseococcus sp. DSY-14]|uniref:hypothetical protein n=1 Tax=Roseococcus sp. DSY-14 TaxID=3369650 RepID=UPI00387B1B56
MTMDYLLHITVIFLTIIFAVLAAAGRIQDAKLLIAPNEPLMQKKLDKIAWCTTSITLIFALPIAFYLIVTNLLGEVVRGRYLSWENLLLYNKYLLPVFIVFTLFILVFTTIRTPKEVKIGLIGSFKISIVKFTASKCKNSEYTENKMRMIWRAFSTTLTFLAACTAFIIAFVPYIFVEMK